MPLQDALTGAGIMNLPYGPFPLPVPLITVVGAPLRLPPFDGEAGSLERAGLARMVHAVRCKCMACLRFSESAQAGV